MEMPLKLQFGNILQGLPSSLAKASLRFQRPQWFAYYQLNQQLRQITHESWLKRITHVQTNARAPGSAVDILIGKQPSTLLTTSIQIRP